MWYRLTTKEGQVLKGIQGKSLKDITAEAKSIMAEQGVCVAYLRKNNEGFGADYGRRTIQKVHRVSI